MELDEKLDIFSDQASTLGYVEDMLVIEEARKKLTSLQTERDALVQMMKRFIAPQDYPEWLKIPEATRKEIEDAE